MRMWMIHPSMLCRKHLLGEHGEIHKHRASFVKKQRISGRIFPIIQIEPLAMKRRHDQLALEIEKRGYLHQSPYKMPSLSYLPRSERLATVDPRLNLHDLADRCSACRTRIINYLLAIQPQGE